MALEATMKHAIRRIASALERYASAQGWRPGDYRVYIRPNEEWGQIHLIVVARAFPQNDLDAQWLSAVEFLDKELKDDPALRDSLHLVLRTFAQVAEGGLYAIGPGYEDVDELLATATVPGNNGR